MGLDRGRVAGFSELRRRLPWWRRLRSWAWARWWLWRNPVHIADELTRLSEEMGLYD